jgi:hypothetical protein
MMMMMVMINRSDASCEKDTLAFLPRSNKRQNVEPHSPASSEDQEKYTKYVSFFWSPLEAALSIANISLFS